MNSPNQFLSVKYIGTSTIILCIIHRIRIFCTQAEYYIVAQGKNCFAGKYLDMYLECSRDCTRFIRANFMRPHLWRAYFQRENISLAQFTVSGYKFYIFDIIFWQHFQNMYNISISFKVLFWKLLIYKWRYHRQTIFNH